ncbi:unnamed protein product [Didymodactylos carnosus]|uniref:Uncharacterized protein n=1 Tax=Didymodactylos carnosus TaxID=1234261 RepID=A0A814DIX9_9BILA|nr:unnamed protein product [Didymodactylos carnosus]CAF0955370.1 unnamed protein product [Didymodactylos carnosus]CAF3584950.1 unnamed protein product [Didymodactylos carnosus]CAF3730484.1 unnamed protein product [Didymodactylos carnosus]
MMINKVKKDPLLQQQIEDIVKSKNNNISVTADSIVSSFTTVFQTFGNRLTEPEDKTDNFEEYNPMVYIF